MTHPPADDLVEMCAEAIYEKSPRYECDWVDGKPKWRKESWEETSETGTKPEYRDMARACLSKAMSWLTESVTRHPPACEQQDETHSGSITNRALKLSTRGPDLWTPKGGG